ncbi:MAG TPA: acyltransferase, partial [Candidatus Acidoferrales bacterium]|nr:acyltransferase [Candidatus Acidoferrales bacterium]
GWTGVDLFFVLSGFLIGGILLDARASSNYFKTFYARRFFRIIPLYYAWILLYVILAPLIRTFFSESIGPIQRVDGSILAHLFFLQNFHEFLKTGASFWWFSSTWSLAVEEQFYLIAPLLVRYLSKRSLATVLVLVTLGAPMLRFAVRNYCSEGPWLAYRLMPCRADALALGMLAALIWNSPKGHEWLERNSLILYGMFTFLFYGIAYLWRWSSDPMLLLTQTAGYTFIALFFAILMLLVLTERAFLVSAVMRFGFLRELGGISYCVYIIHTAVFFFSHQLILHALPAVTDVRAALVTFLAALLTYGIAKLSWKYVEQPQLRRGHAFRYDFVKPKYLQPTESVT